MALKHFLTICTYPKSVCQRNKRFSGGYRFRISLTSLFCVYFTIFLLFSCGSSPDRTADTGFNDPWQIGQIAGQPASGSIAEEIRYLTESGILSSMIEALDLIHSRNLGGTDFGRMMNGINTMLIRLVYPDFPETLPVIDLPLTFNYTRIIREAARGVYVNPPEDSTDFFEFILPFFTVTDQLRAVTFAGQNNQSNRDFPMALVPIITRDLEIAANLNPASVLPFFFMALLNERLNNFEAAERFHNMAYAVSEMFFPALIGIARTQRLSGNPQTAAGLFSDLSVRFPNSLEIRKELAISFFENRNLQAALPIINEVLISEPRNADFIFMRAFILIEQESFPQAGPALDTLSSINPNNRQYLFLRARLQFEGNRNREAALNYLRSILQTNPNDEEALIYAVTLLLESPRPADHIEGRELLQRLRTLSGSSINVMSLSLRDAVTRESWQEALGFLNNILAVRRTVQDLIDGFHIERALGNNARALVFARELYAQDPSNNEYVLIFISSLIDNGRNDEASRLLEERIRATGRGPMLSRFYFLRSRLQTDENAALSDLRASLFEDPRNLDALIAIFQIYHRRRQERRAVHYLRQALAIAPNHPQLQRYEREYAALLGR
ncbi:MAG: hypothetical protein FWC97_04510 [Treponema sp.]|nr:hypothetical protein [Treponema sp.]